MEEKDKFWLETSIVTVMSSIIFIVVIFAWLIQFELVQLLFIIIIVVVVIILAVLTTWWWLHAIRMVIEDVIDKRQEKT